MGNGKLIVPGTAVPADVRASKEFSAGQYYGAQGAMTEYSGTRYTPTAAGILIPAGYHDGTTGTTAEPNLTAPNIKTGVSVFGVIGTLVAGVPFATGSITSSSTTLSFNDNNVTAHNEYYVEVSGLTFTPKFIQVIRNPLNGTDWTIYDGYETLISSSPAPIHWNGGGIFFQLTGNANVTSTGFRLPVGLISANYTWRAWG